MQYVPDCDRIHERDEQTDRQMDGRTNDTARRQKPCLCIAPRGKKVKNMDIAREIKPFNIQNANNFLFASNHLDIVYCNLPNVCLMREGIAQRR